MIHLIDYSSLPPKEQETAHLFVGQLYEATFPPEERRSQEDLQHALLHPDCHLSLVREETEATGFLGFLISWELSPTLTFIEHFAILPECRNRQLGSTILKLLTEQVTNAEACMLLEAEPPLTEIARRRIGFYERAGFEIIDTEYLQPSYHLGGAAVPLYLLAFNAQGTNLTEMIRLLYKRVYQTAFPRLP